MEVFCRHGRPQLGAEELLELGRPVPMFRYAHTPYLAGRVQANRVQLQGSGGLLREERNLLGQAAPAQAGSSTLTKALIIGIPLAFVVGVFALT
jgi:hypothetical protein